MNFKDPNKREAMVPELEDNVWQDMKSCQGAPHLKDRQTWLKNFGFIHTRIVCHHCSKSTFKIAYETDAGLSEESDQPQVREPSLMESVSVGSRCGSTEEPQRLSGIYPIPSPNPSNTQPCATPTMRRSDGGPGKEEEIRSP